MNNSLGEAIKGRRQSKKLTLKQVHDVSGVSVSYLGRVERGERFPSGGILRKLAEPLGFTETELLKLAGFLSRDETDERIERLKREVKSEVVQALSNILGKIDRL